MQDKYDIIIIGAGPGGYVAAIKAAQEGFTVALIEEREAGGTCLNRGCIPTKTLIHSSHLYREMKSCENLGITIDSISYDMEKLYSRKNDVVINLRTGIEFLIKSNKVELINGKALITDKQTVQVAAEGENITLHGDKIIIAVGSVPAKPRLEGIDLPGVLTSDDLLGETGKDYKNLVILGGGVIGVEFANIFNSLGCQVTIIEAMDRILPVMDVEISRNLNMILKKRGVAIYTSSELKRFEQGEEGIICHFTQKGKEMNINAEAVLIAVGRRPNVQGLFAEGIMEDCTRGITVDEYFRTDLDGVYAIGDVIKGSISLAHAASAQGCHAVAHIAGKTSEISFNAVPACVYTDPEIASVGITAEQAKAEGIGVKIGKYSMAGNGKSVIEEQERGFIKLIFHAETGVILGAHLMCARATDLISELSTAIVNGLTAKQLESVIRPHPTFTEGVTEAVEEAFGKAVHVVHK